MSFSMFCVEKKTNKKPNQQPKKTPNSHQSLRSVVFNISSDVLIHVFQISIFVRFMPAKICLSTLACMLIVSFTLLAVHRCLLSEQ